MEDLQSLLEKINRDGVQKAEAKAAEIVKSAEDRAASIVNDARAKAEKAKAAADKDAADYAERAQTTVAQAARDTVLKIESSVTALLENLLVRNVDKALADEATVAELVRTAVRDLTGPGEIACGEKLAGALAAQLSALGSFTVVTDGFQGTGFTVKTDGGRVEHSFTGETIAAELAKRLRPDLAKLVAGR